MIRRARIAQVPYAGEMTIDLPVGLPFDTLLVKTENRADIRRVKVIAGGVALVDASRVMLDLLYKYEARGSRLPRGIIFINLELGARVVGRLCALALLVETAKPCIIEVIQARRALNEGTQIAYGF